MYGKCPKCESAILSAVMNGIEVSDGYKSWKAITYNCPSCQTVIGCQIDPIAIKSDIVDELFKKLRK